jgi:hypothetical protein
MALPASSQNKSESIIDVYKEIYKQDPVIMRRIAHRLQDIKDSDDNYNTIKETLLHKTYENEIKDELIYGMEGVIEDQIEKIEKLENEVEITKKYLGDSVKERVQKLCKSSFNPPSIQEKRTKSRALISEQIRKNRAITDK